MRVWYNQVRCMTEEEDQPTFYRTRDVCCFSQTGLWKIQFVLNELDKHFFKAGNKYQPIILHSLCTKLLIPKVLNNLEEDCLMGGISLSAILYQLMHRTNSPIYHQSFQLDPVTASVLVWFTMLVSIEVLYKLRRLLHYELVVSAKVQHFMDIFRTYIEPFCHISQT